MNDDLKICLKPEGAEMEGGQNMSQFSHDKRSYVAAKIIPGFGTLIYMACTDYPELGWDENGFANFSDISDISNLKMMNPKDMMEHHEQTLRDNPPPQRRDEAGSSKAPY